MDTPTRAIPRLTESHWLGSLPDFRASRVEFQRKAMREHADIARVRLGVFEVLAVGSPELVHEILIAQEDAFVKSYGLSLFARPLLGDGLITSEHALHRRQRRLLAPAFVPRALATYTSVMAERAGSALSRMLQAREVDISDQTMRITLEVVGKTLFDADFSEAAAGIGPLVTQAMECIMGAMKAPVPTPPFIPTPTNRKLHNTISKLDAIVYALIAARRARVSPGEDMLALLLAARDEDGRGMSDRQLRDEVMTMFLAGHETTAVALGWTLTVLARHPEVRRQVEAELDAVLGDAAPALADLAQLPLLLRVLKETLRLYPPVYMLGRRAIRATQLRGYGVRKGQVVLINVFGMHHRADLFPDPERFDPDRFLPEREASLPRHAFLPFGAGARMCVGNHFALMEAQLVLATWLKRARFELVEPERQIAFEPLITLRPKGPLRMRVVSR